MKKWTIGLIIAGLALAVPAAARAHEGHEHKVMGTVSSIDGTNVLVKDKAGKTVHVMTDAKTKITQGKETVAFSALKVGDRVVAAGTETQGMIQATSVEVGTAPVKAAAKPAKRK